MPNQDLINYINQAKAEGISNQKIKEDLLKVGWNQADIDEAFNIPAQVPVQLPKKRHWKKIILIISGSIVILIVVILLLPKFLSVFSKDIAPINDSDLQLQKVSIPDKDNAYFDLIKISDAIYQPKDKSQTILDMAAGKTWDNQVAEEIVSRNAQVFRYLTEAANKTKFQELTFADPANITINTSPTSVSLASIRAGARLSAIHAMYLAKQGKDKEAINEALNLIKIGQKIEESQAPLIEYLVAISIKRIGLETIQKIIVSSKLNSDELSGYAQELNVFYKNKDGLIKSFKGEYHLQSWVIDALASGNKEALQEIVNQEMANKIKDNYYFQPNKTKLLFAENAGINIKNANESCSENEAIVVKQLTSINPVKLYTEENAIGKILHDTMTTNLTGVKTRKCHEDLLVAATQTALAIKAFKTDKNKYPLSLDELVPNYLSSIPTDPFDGKSLKYSAAKKIIYSTGEKLKDLGGSIGEDWATMPNPTFKIEF